MNTLGCHSVVKKQKKLKPARKQVKPGDTGKEYNIWYIKHALSLPLFLFSRGRCPYGWECEYLDTLPDPERALPDSSEDCFARDKFSDCRDDMGGVGTFTRPNRMFYVGRAEDVVRRHFKRVGYVSSNIARFAFVTYVSEHNAQFAKEAMSCQSMDNDEILNVRWATEDPNPTSKVAEKRRLEEMGQAAIPHSWALEEGRDYQADDGVIDEDLEEEDDGGGKRRRIEGPDTEVPSAPQETVPETSQRLLSAETLESLRYFSELRRQNGAALAPPSPAVLAKAQRPSAGLGLGDHGSDDDD
ncbi:hypothetical protein F5148DRAFT_1275452 [Russula earlei]|uniref:Uncharacterized protein n=1 Tax=Russula earlei TaxID=71964 RepID=A0ACC0UDD9_9AGAM|nr:hypothetical protein F5148DRAFT_1275452 [Russula earlei]